MRIIKFRAWDSEQLTYSENKFDEEGQNHELEMFFLSINVGAALSDKSYSLMQFTGLLDKNGREIYEGDIIGVSNNIENEICQVPCKIKWDNGQFIAEDTSGGSWTRQLYHHPERIEVIGNIYEHEYLLK